MRDTVTVIRPALKDSRGSKVPDWDNATSKSISRVQVVPAGTVQDRDGRVVNVTDRYKLRAMFDADIRAGDRIVWRGCTYEVDGDVFHTKSPTDRISSTRCQLVRWEG